MGKYGEVERKVIMQERFTITSLWNILPPGREIMDTVMKNTK